MRILFLYHGAGKPVCLYRRCVFRIAYEKRQSDLFFREYLRGFKHARIASFRQNYRAQKSVGSANTEVAKKSILHSFLYSQYTLRGFKKRKTAAQSAAVFAESTPRRAAN